MNPSTLFLHFYCRDSTYNKGSGIYIIVQEHNEQFPVAYVSDTSARATQCPCSYRRLRIDAAIHVRLTIISNSGLAIPLYTVYASHSDRRYGGPLCAAAVADGALRPCACVRVCERRRDITPALLSTRRKTRTTSRCITLYTLNPTTFLVGNTICTLSYQALPSVV